MSHPKSRFTMLEMLESRILMKKDRALPVPEEIISAAAAVSATAIFQQGVNGYTGVQDTYVRNDAVGTNFGSGTKVVVSEDDSSKKGDQEAHGLLRFDGLFGSASGQIPANATITGATLTIHTGNDDGDSSSNVTSFYRMLHDWNESTATWNSMGSGLSNNGTEALRTADGTMRPNTLAAPVSMDVTAALQAWAADPSSNKGWALISGGRNSWYFNSSEFASAGLRPALSVTYTVPNAAPVVNAGADAAINLPAVAQLDGTLEDDGQPLPAGLSSLWEQVSGPGTVEFGDATAVDTTASFSEPGEYVLRLTAADGQLSGSDEVTITVGAANVAPTVSAGDDATVTLPNTAALDGSVSDDGLPLPSGLNTQWTKVSGEGDVTFTDDSLVDTTASFSAPGTYVLKLTASDGEYSTNDEVTITVESGNAAPTVSAGDDAQVVLPGLASLDGTVDDDGLPIPSGVTTQWTKVSGDGDVTFADDSLVDTTASFSAPGTYVLKLTATDGELSSSDEITITVLPQNTAPTVSAGDDATISLPNGAALDGTVSDDGYPLPAAVSTQWTQVSGDGTASFADDTAIDTSATFSQAGTYVLRLTANDGEYSVSDEVTITVEPANVAPTVNAGDDAQVILPGVASLDGTVSDDGLPLPSSLTREWTKVSGDGEVVFGDDSLEDTTASFSQAGEYVLRLTVSDGDLSSFDEVTITVVDPAAENQAPTVDAGSGSTISLPGLASLDGTVDDDGLPLPSAVTTQWTKVSGDGDVTFTDDSAVDTTAGFSAPGTYVLRLTASDGELSSFDEVTITVGAANVAPAVNAGDDATISLPNGASLDGTVSDDGLPSGNLVVTWSKIDGDGTVSFADASAVDTTATFSQAGTYTLRLTVSDGEYQTTDDVVITVEPANTAPTVNAGADAAISLPNTASLDGTVSDDGLPLPSAVTTTWTKVSGDGDVTFTDASAIDTTASFTTPGTYVLRLTATDGELSSFDEVTITVGAANTAPTVSAGDDATISLPAGVSLDGTVTDDGLPTSNLVIEWTQVDGDGTASFADGNAVDTTATFSAPGTYTLRLSVSDGEYLTTDDVVITVLPQNQPPTVNAGVDAVISLPTTSASLDGTVGDDGLPLPPALTQQWTQVGGPTGGTATFGDASAADTTVSFSTSGVYTLRLTATDGAGLSTFDEVVITVNAPPTANAGTDASVSLPNSASLDGTAGDDGLPLPASLTSLWTKVSGEGDVTFANASAVDTTAGFSAAGTYVLRLTVTDGAGASSFDEVTITVNPQNQAPAVNAGTDALVNFPSGASLDGTVTDDGQPLPASLTTTWTRVGGPVGGTVTFANASLVDTTATFSSPGTYTLRLTATDGGGLSTFDEVVITVNRPPVVDAGTNFGVTLPNQGALNGTVTDDGLPTGALVTSLWTVDSTPAGGSVTFANASAIDTNATFSIAGTYVLRLTASDTASSTFDTVTVTVTNPTPPPPPVTETTTLGNMTISTNTGEKPQSKVWKHDGSWWGAFATTAGTAIWKLVGTAWQSQLTLSSSTAYRADVKSVGGAAYVLLHDENSATVQLASLQYTGSTYSLSQSLTPITLEDATETATIDIDGDGRMWLAYTAADEVWVQHSGENDYDTWSAPINLTGTINAESIDGDDIATVVAFPDGKVGVMWSNQSSDRFGFSVYDPDTATSTSDWGADELADFSDGDNMADDHLNVKVASDGTLYAAVKTSYDSSDIAIGLLVRRPNGTWDDTLYDVNSGGGTRGIVVLNEAENAIMVLYTDSTNPNPIRYRISSMSNISFGDEETLISQNVNNASTTKQNMDSAGDVVVVAGSANQNSSQTMRGVQFVWSSSVGGSSTSAQIASTSQRSLFSESPIASDEHTELLLDDLAIL